MNQMLEPKKPLKNGLNNINELVDQYYEQFKKATTYLQDLKEKGFGVDDYRNELNYMRMVFEERLGDNNFGIKNMFYFTLGNIASINDVLFSVEKSLELFQKNRKNINNYKALLHELNLEQDRNKEVLYKRIMDYLLKAEKKNRFTSSGRGEMVESFAYLQMVGDLLYRNNIYSIKPAVIESYFKTNNLL